MKHKTLNLSLESKVSVRASLKLIQSNCGEFRNLVLKAMPACDNVPGTNKSPSTSPSPFRWVVVEYRQEREIDATACKSATMNCKKILRGALNIFWPTLIFVFARRSSIPISAFLCPEIRHNFLLCLSLPRKWKRKTSRKCQKVSKDVYPSSIPYFCMSKRPSLLGNLNITSWNFRTYV